MSKDYFQIELDLLQFLCTGRSGTQAREEVISQLRRYAFQRVEHQVLFDCLQAMPLDRPELIRELLPARLVRAGFPDFDLAPFFEVREMSEEEALTMCRELTRSVAVKARKKRHCAGPSSLCSSG